MTGRTQWAGPDSFFCVCVVWYAMQCNSMEVSDGCSFVRNWFYLTEFRLPKWRGSKVKQENHFLWRHRRCLNTLIYILCTYLVSVVVAAAFFSKWRRTRCDRSTTVTIWLTCLRLQRNPFFGLAIWFSHYKLARPNDYYELFAQSSRNDNLPKELRHWDPFPRQFKSIREFSYSSDWLSDWVSERIVVLWVWDWVSYKSPLLKFRGHKRTAPVSEMLLAFWFMNFKMNYLN